MKLLKKASVTLILTGIFIWLVETIYFFIAYGWHMKAINEREKFYDDISSVLLSLGLILGFVVLIKSVRIINIIKED